MFKKIYLLALTLLLALGLTACGPTPVTPDGQGEDSAKIQVAVSFDAMQEFVAAVGGDRVAISTIIPAGIEAHDFEPKAQDLVKLGQSDLFVYNGLGMETWAENALSSANNPDLIVVLASQGANLIESSLEDDHREGSDEEGHHHGAYDPHLWLSLKEAQFAAGNIRDALTQLDSDHKDFYASNHAAFVQATEDLYQTYAAKFQPLERKTFVTGHAAFAYLCRDFGLEQNSIRNIFADGEPSAKQMVALVDFCRTNDVTTIFAEEMVSPAVSETLAKEVGARVEILYTMENAQDGLTYLERMEHNLSKIYESLAE